MLPFEQNLDSVLSLIPLDPYVPPGGSAEWVSYFKVNSGEDWEIAPGPSPVRDSTKSHPGDTSTMPATTPEPLSPTIPAYDASATPGPVSPSIPTWAYASSDFTESQSEPVPEHKGGRRKSVVDATDEESSFNKRVKVESPNVTVLARGTRRPSKIVILKLGKRRQSQSNTSPIANDALTTPTKNDTTARSDGTAAMADSRTKSTHTPTKPTSPKRTSFKSTSPKAMSPKQTSPKPTSPRPVGGTPTKSTTPAKKPASISLNEYRRSKQSGNATGNATGNTTSDVPATPLTPVFSGASSFPKDNQSRKDFFTKYHTLATELKRRYQKQTKRDDRLLFDCLLCYTAAYIAGNNLGGLPAFLEFFRLYLSPDSPITGENQRAWLNQLYAIVSLYNFDYLQSAMNETCRKLEAIMTHDEDKRRELCERLQRLTKDLTTTWKYMRRSSSAGAQLRRPRNLSEGENDETTLLPLPGMQRTPLDTVLSVSLAFLATVEEGGEPPYSYEAASIYRP